MFGAEVDDFVGFRLEQTKANELKSLLPLKMKRDMIKAIHAGCPAWKDDPEKQQEVLARYKQYADQVNSRHLSEPF